MGEYGGVLGGIGGAGLAGVAGGGIGAGVGAGGGKIHSRVRAARARSQIRRQGINLEAMPRAQGDAPPVYGAAVQSPALPLTRLPAPPRRTSPGDRLGSFCPRPASDLTQAVAVSPAHGPHESMHHEPLRLLLLLTGPLRILRAAQAVAGETFSLTLDGLVAGRRYRGRECQLNGPVSHSVVTEGNRDECDA
jgi:hypothetical protein